MTTNLTTALNEFKPSVASRYTNMVTNTLARMQKRLGPHLKGVGNSWEFARIWNRLVADHVTHTPEGYVINQPRLAKQAEEYAEAAIAEWRAKIERKLGELEQAKVVLLPGDGRFYITGVRHDRKVSISQQMILNVSSKGVPFNQFPARIKVDGKAISEAAYRKELWPSRPSPVRRSPRLVHGLP